MAALVEHRHVSAYDTLGSGGVYTTLPHHEESDFDREREMDNSLDNDDLDDSEQDHLALVEGDIIGEGLDLQGFPLLRVNLPRLAPNPSRASLDADGDNDPDSPTNSFEVVRKLGNGSYAVVYLVREIIGQVPSHSRPLESEGGEIFDLDSDSGHSGSASGSIVGPPSTASSPASSATAYGREFAIKCLSKANLDKEQLQAQLLEATLHQNLPIHPNIVTLYRTLETPAYLILLLEFVPGEDLFYFLESARDHYAVDYPNPSSSTSSLSKTPTTPSLLSALHPATLLSHTRLRLVASMFAQMCEAVAACHARGVYHRDIKPENFIVTERTTISGDRRVVVKLTDFGLATTDQHSSDMDCGSAPYMSYECRNNLAPTYEPRIADVWSLGIVLINMLYHHNPWSDTSLSEERVCPSFDAYHKADREGRIAFFQKRFVGMNTIVAGWLARRIFCFADNTDGDVRATAEEFGVWVRGLPDMLGSEPAVPPHFGSNSKNAIGIHRVPRSRRPSIRSLGAPYFNLAELVTPSEPAGPPMPDPDIDDRSHDDEEEVASRVSTGARRRKRGARNKSKNSATPRDEDVFSGLSPPNSSVPSLTDRLDRLDDMAVKSQLLARELSKVRVTSSNQTSSTSLPLPMPVSAPANMEPHPRFPIEELQQERSHKGKKRGWKGIFRMASGEALSSTTQPLQPFEAVPILPLRSPNKNEVYGSENGRSDSTSRLSTSSKGSTGVAANVSNLVLGLNAVPPPSTHSRHSEERGRPTRPVPKASPPMTWAPNPRLEYVPGPKNPTAHPNPYNTSRRPDQSPNWRNSTSTNNSASSTSSNWTRYSNGSARSVESTATSASGGSWRSGAGDGAPKAAPSPSSPTSPTAKMPRNIKVMNGVPWELTQLPRQCHPRPEGDIFGAPPSRKSSKYAQSKTLASPLDTISERPSTSAGQGGTLGPIAERRKDAATSTTDLTDIPSSPTASSPGAGALDDGQKKVQKGQINALAKMLSALRRPGS